MGAVNYSRMQNKMLDLDLDDLTLDKAFKICQRVELNDKHYRTLRPDTRVESES